MMSFMGPSRDNPTPQSPGQKILWGGVIVAVLAVAGTVLLTLSEVVDTATLPASIGDLITLPFVLIVIGLCFIGFLIGTVHF